MQRLIGDLVISADDAALNLFLNGNFLALPTYDDKHFKTKILLDQITEMLQTLLYHGYIFMIFITRQMIMMLISTLFQQPEPYDVECTV